MIYRERLFREQNQITLKQKQSTELKKISRDDDDVDVDSVKFIYIFVSIVEK